MTRLLTFNALAFVLMMGVAWLADQRLAVM